MSFASLPYGVHRALPSFPTRRSSDLHAERAPPAVGPVRLGQLVRTAAEPGQVLPAGGSPAGVQDRLGVPEPGPSEHGRVRPQDRKSTRLNSSHVKTSYAVFCLKKKKQ